MKNPFVQNRLGSRGISVALELSPPFVMRPKVQVHGRCVYFMWGFIGIHLMGHSLMGVINWLSARTRNKIDDMTDEQIRSACLSYRHDFGLLDADQQNELMYQARDWARALSKELERDYSANPARRFLHPRVETLKKARCAHEEMKGNNDD